MQPITRFALEAHAGPYDRWPATTALLADGLPTGARVPGYVIDAQFATPLGTLLVTSYDCPFEEANTFLLLDDAHRIVARTDLGAMYASWLLAGCWPTSATSLALHYHQDLFHDLDLLPPGGWWRRRPRLRLRRRDDWRADARMVAARDALQVRLADIDRALAADGVATRDASPG